MKKEGEKRGRGEKGKRKEGRGGCEEGRDSKEGL